MIQGFENDNQEAATIQRSSSPILQEQPEGGSEGGKCYRRFVNSLHKPARISKVRGVPTPPPGILSGYLVGKSNRGQPRYQDNKVI